MKIMFNKKNLKNRMVVELRNGTKLMVVGKMLMGSCLSRDIDSYSDSLRDGYGCAENDIVKVYAPIKFINFDYANDVIYDRYLDESVVVEGMNYPSSCAHCRAHSYSYGHIRCTLMPYAALNGYDDNNIVDDYIAKISKHPKCPVRKRGSVTKTEES